MKHSSSRDKIGLIEFDVSPKEEYRLLAQEDENVAKVLLIAGFERQAAYHVVQAMEKYIRGKIYSFVDPKSDSVRQQNQTHSVEESIDYLLNVFPADARLKDQIKNALDTYVTQGTRFSLLHNNLRYPYYSPKHRTFSLILIGRDDVDELLRRLDWLKSFLDGIDKFNTSQPQPSA
jgi:hypothetical protein